MKLRHFLYSFLFFSLLFLSYSCNNDNTVDYGPSQLSADAQIYAFTLKGTPVSKKDSIAYPILAKTKFTIDQFAQEIYNVDSLPYQMTLRGFIATVTYGNANPSKVEVIFRNSNDSIAEWNGTDSINFSKNDISLKVTPQNANASSAKTYAIKLNIHQIDPDTIIWKQISSLNYTQSSAQEKVLLHNEIFYRFNIANGVVSLQTAVKNDPAPTWSNQAVSGLPNNISLKSITYFGNNFFAVSQSGDSYYSSDASSWYKANNELNIQQIVGVVPEASETKDSLLVVTKENENYYLARTCDFTTFGSKILINNQSVFDYTKFINLLKTNFFTCTNYDRGNQSMNYMIFAGIDESNSSLMSWVFLSQDEKLRVSKNSEKVNPFGHGKSMANNQLFEYDNNVYALSNNSLYISKNLIKNWSKAPSKQVLDKGMKENAGQTIIVDKDNFIWIFGPESTAQAEVRRGRLNRLIK